ncbi:MAG TPA: zf-HC2 domain-containing protein [Casimicrobiaceae bacterium]|nr:zf-HC2 domain-containing protein [Casimicrobiaceae bacterium]
MNCKQAETLVGAYADGEVDALRGFSLKRHFTGCGHCAARYADILSLRARIRAEVPVFTSPAALQARVRAMASAVQAAAPQAGRASGARWRWMSGGALAGCAATLFAWSVGTVVLESRADDDFVVAAASTHTRAALGNRLIEVASSDRHTVKPWLSARLDYSPPVDDLAADGFPLIGGRIDTIDHHRVATLVYGYGHHTIDVFVRPAASLALVRPMRVVRGFNVVRASGRDMDWVAVSDAEPEAVAALMARLVHDGSAR